MDVASSMKPPTTSPMTLSYADRAKKAQNIRSPIANMVHAVSVSMSTSASSGTSSNTSATSSINGSSAVPSSSSTDFDATDITAPTTSNSSVVLESDTEGAASSDATSKGPEETKKERGKDDFGLKPAPTIVPNVWQVRKEQMAMVKAQRAREEESSRSAQVATEKDKSPVQSSTVTASSTTTSSPPASTSSSNKISSSSSTSTTTEVTTHAPTMTNGLSSATTSSSSSSVSASTTVPSPKYRESQNPKDLEVEKHDEDGEDDPFVVNQNRRANPWKPIPPPVPAPLLSASAASAGAIPTPQKTSLGQTVPDLGDTESWPEVGVGVTPHKGQDHLVKGKGKSNEEDELSGEQKGENLTQNVPKSGKTKSKTKWVPIPAEEMQAAVDAAAPERRQARSQTNAVGRPAASSQANSQPHSQSQSRSRTHSRNPSQSRVQLSNGLVNGSGSGVTFAARSGGQVSGSSSVSQSAAHSLTHSRVHSRAGSVQASPRFSREVRLPPDVEEKTVAEFDPRALSSQFDSKGASGSGTPPVAVDAGSSPLPPVLPVQIQNQQYTSYNTPAALPNYFPNGQYSHPNSHPGSHPASPPPPVPNMPFAMPHSNNAQSPPPPPPQLNIGMGPSLPSLPYHSPYSVYPPSMYDYPPHPSMSPIQTNQMYWPGMGPSPGGSGHQTPLYAGGGPFVMTPMADYGSYAPMHQVYGHPPQNYGETYVQQVQEYPPIVSRPEETINPTENTQGDLEGQTQKVVFGSFDEDESEMKRELPSVPPFSIGLGPGEAGPSRLASTQKDPVVGSGKRRFSKRKASGVLMLNDRAEVVDLTDALSSMEEKDTGEVVVDGKGKGKMQWQFGKFGVDREEEEQNQDSDQNRHDNIQHPYGVPQPHLPQPTPPHPTLPPPFVPVGGVHVPVPPPVPPIPLSSLTSLPPIHTSAYPHPIPPHPGLSHLGHFSAGSVTSPTSLGPNGSSFTGERDGATESGRPNMGEDQGGEDYMRTQVPPSEGSEWEVRDFGYGFGRDGKNGKPRDAENLQRGDRPPSPSRIGPNTNAGVRPRRGSYSYNNNYSGYSDRGLNSGYSRRGRGFNGRGTRGLRGGLRGGYGYGYDRDRDFDTSSRGGPPRGGRNGVRDTHGHQQPPFTLTPPPQFQPLPMPGVPGAPHAQENGLHTYIPLPTGFEGQFGYGHSQSQSPVLSRHPGPSMGPGTGAPVPVPLTHISFPLDPTTYYLLGQLEYYLSPQNMAQDLFLRKKMDSHGWVPIPLIASFNRVRQLTMDLDFVRDVLHLSQVVEVRGDNVRMKGWEQFVLPDAEASHVDLGSEPLSAASLAAPMMQGEDSRHSAQGRAVNGHVELHNVVEEAIMKHKPVEGRIDDEAEREEVDEEEEEEEEEEEVVFVMGGESGLWSPEQNS